MKVYEVYRIEERSQSLFISTGEDVVKQKVNRNGQLKNWQKCADDLCAWLIVVFPHDACRELYP